MMRYLLGLWVSWWWMDCFGNYRLQSRLIFDGRGWLVCLDAEIAIDIL